MRGPIDYIIVGFEGNNFKGEILKELEKVTNKGIVAVLDLAMIVKDKDGNVTSMELSEIDDAVITEFAKSKGNISGIVTDDDVAEVASLMPNNTSAGLLVVEQLWAKGLKKAIGDAGGVLIAEGRIHPDAEEEIDKQKGDK